MSRNHSPSPAKRGPFSTQEQIPDVFPAKETLRKMGKLQKWRGLMGAWQEFSISRASEDPLLRLPEPGRENERWGILKCYFFSFLSPDSSRRQFLKWQECHQAGSARDCEYLTPTRASPSSCLFLFSWKESHPRLPLLLPPVCY